MRASADDVVCVMLVPPSVEAQIERLRARGDSEAHIAKRVALGEKEIAEAGDVVDATIVNDDLDQAVSDLAAIVAGARRRFAR